MQTDGLTLTKMIENAKAFLQNTLNVTYVGLVWVDYINDALTVIAGLTLIWWNVERAMHARQDRKSDEVL